MNEGDYQRAAEMLEKISGYQDSRALLMQCYYYIGAALMADGEYARAVEYFDKAPDLLALADHYDCTVDYLLGRDENPTRDADLQAMCHYTGLSEVSLNRLNYEFNQEHTGDVFIDVLDYILRDYTMRDIGKLVYDAVCLRDLSKDLPIDYVEQGIDWANSHELPAGFDIVEAPRAKEFSVEHAAFVLRDAINRFVEMWHGHETYRAEMLQREKALRDSVMALYEKHNPSGASEEEEHGEHR